MIQTLKTHSYTSLSVCTLTFTCAHSGLSGTMMANMKPGSMKRTTSNSHLQTMLPNPGLMPGMMGMMMPGMSSMSNMKMHLPMPNMNGVCTLFIYVCASGSLDVRVRVCLCARIRYKDFYSLPILTHECCHLIF